MHWENENSISVVNENQVVGADVVLSKGIQVDVSPGTIIGRQATFSEHKFLKFAVSSILLFRSVNNTIHPIRFRKISSFKLKKHRQVTLQFNSSLTLLMSGKFSILYFL